METLDLTIADTGVRLVLEASLAAQVQSAYAGFVGGTPHYRITVERLPPTPIEPAAVTALVSGPEHFTLARPPVWRLAVDRERRTGTLACAIWPVTPHGRAPGAIDSSLRALVACELVWRGGLLLHASAVELPRGGVVFVGESGAGKSTVCAMFGEPAILNDELVGVAPEPDGATVRVHATPFSGSADGPRARRSATLAALFALAKSDRTHIDPLSSAGALRLLMRCVALPAGDPATEARAFANAALLSESAPWHTLAMTLEPAMVTAAVTAALAARA